MSHVTIPREPTPSLLRPFIGCNTQELHEAWAAMVRIAEVEYARSGSQCLAQIEEPAQPVLYVSTAQLEEHRDPDFPDHGRYLPARKTPAGMFTQPLYAKADPADVARPAIAALQIIAHWPITGETNMDAANMRAVARKALAAPALEAPAAPVGEVVYRWQALDFSGYCYGSNPPEDLPARCNLTPFYRQPDAYRAALHEISATGNLTATGQQFARHLQQIARDALAAAPQAQAAPAVPTPELQPISTYVEVHECSYCGHVGINDADGSKAACITCDWRGDSPTEDKCPGCHAVGTMTSACPECGSRTSLLAETHLLAAAPQAPAAPASNRIGQILNSASEQPQDTGTVVVAEIMSNGYNGQVLWKGKVPPVGTLLYAAPVAAPAAPAVDALDATGRECLAIGRAVNRAALELPADGEIRIDIENGAGAVYVYEPQREDHRYIDSGDVFSAQINAAIDAAIAAQAAAQGGEA